MNHTRYKKAIACIGPKDRSEIILTIKIIIDVIWKFIIEVLIQLQIVSMIFIKAYNSCTVYPPKKIILLYYLHHLHFQANT